MQSFEYIRTTSIAETVNLLASEGDRARILCGGTDLLVQLREGRRKANLVIDIKGIPELNELTFDPIQGLRIGAAVSCLRISQNNVITQHYPGLIDAVSIIGGIQIQGRASLGGNLCNASPAADSVPALIVHHARCIIAGAAGLCEIPVEHFCKAPGQTSLQPGELLVSLHIPPPQPLHGAHYQRFIPRNEMDIAVVGVGAAVTLDESYKIITAARIALAAVAPTPLYVAQAGSRLVGCEISEYLIDDAATIAQSATQPITDMRGSADQRFLLSRVLTRRALWRAIERAKTSKPGIVSTEIS